MGGNLRHSTRSLKRHTWPRTPVECMETIPESPRTPKQATLPDLNDALPDRTPQYDCDPLLDSESCIRVEERVVPSEAFRSQMLWYSYHLAQSHQERERLSTKIKELEIVCKSQSRTNASLLKDIRSWQSNYESIEAEMLEAVQEIEEAKAYVRSIETANANLRYALSQAKEEQERARRQKWRTYLSKYLQNCKQMTSSVASAGRSTTTQKPIPSRKEIADRTTVADRNTNRPASRLGWHPFRERSSSPISPSLFRVDKQDGEKVKLDVHEQSSRVL